MSGTVNLGPRLSLVASYVPKGAQLGDIGTDHAYLPIYLWENGRIERAVAVDVHEGPYKSARSAIQSRKLETQIDVRFGDGLKPIEPGEVDTLTLAGMGGNTMLEIFAVKPEVLARVNTLVLQPQGAEGKVRISLLKSGWKLVDEKLVEEEGRIYVVMKFTRNEGFTFEEVEDKVQRWFGQVSIKEGSEILNRLVWELGPLVLERPISELEVLINEQIQTLVRATHEMQKSRKIEVHERIQELNQTRFLLEGMKKCLFPSV
jgi:tRNA (adenine22-N1)-methyltransferase